MVELAVYRDLRGGTLMMPRTIVQTVAIQKLTVEVSPELLVTSTDLTTEPSASPEWDAEKRFYKEFWTELIAELSFDDPGQAYPNIAQTQNLYLYPSQSKYAWISAYFAKSSKQVGVYFRCRNDEIGNAIFQRLSEEKEAIRKELGENVTWGWAEDDGPSVRLAYDDVFNTGNRKAIKAFFCEWLNTFVNVFRPRMKNI